MGIIKLKITIMSTLKKKAINEKIIGRNGKEEPEEE